MRPILVVEDNPANRRLVQIVLHTNGYVVREAVDAEQALAALQDGFRPRLILMDIQLPGMDGLELTRRLKADPATRGIPIVAMTAFAMKADEEKARRAGCDGYLKKPCPMQLLLTTVEKFAGGPKG